MGRVKRAKDTNQRVTTEPNELKQEGEPTSRGTPHHEECAMNSEHDMDVDQDDACVEALLLLRYVRRDSNAGLETSNTMTLPEGWAEGMRFLISAKGEQNKSLVALKNRSVNTPASSPRAAAAETLVRIPRQLGTVIAVPSDDEESEELASSEDEEVEGG